MRSTVIITKKGEGYYVTVSSKLGVAHQNARAGLTTFDAAATAALHMIQYAQSNDEGGDLMAPAEVLELVPMHLRNIDAESI